MKIRLASPLQIDSIVDGPGIRAVIWTQGCPHKCVGCHNPITHSAQDGYLEDVEALKNEISSSRGQTGITFSGGDPMVQAASCSIIAKHSKELGLDVWCYTGYTYEELMNIAINNEAISQFLDYIDVLVDGKFLLKEKSLELKYKGSKNQRIIDVPKTIRKNKIYLHPLEISIKKDNDALKGIYI